ncbi:MAG TPA: hypothetical protein VMY42_19075 [Thermoguttaceae bacterium]|nr:hypothetical protein [Thermoguttaceae bacterium]
MADPDLNAPARRALLLRFRAVLLVFITGLVLSGLTAFPLLYEVRWLAEMLGIPDGADYRTFDGLRHWVGYVRQGLEDSYRAYPFIAYGTDWLAFAHIVVAVFFLGPLLKPGEGDWIFISGMIACGLVIPLALICGSIRGIPFYWRLIDCSFGILGFFPLAYCYRLNRKIWLMDR